MLGLLGALWALAGCSHSGGAPEAARWIAGAAAAHEHADQALARGDREAARADLSSLVASPAPDAVAPSDRRLVLQDALARLAHLELLAGRAEQAQALAERGLALGRERDLFAANLLTARGQAREALGQDRAAADDYHEALLIDEALLRETLEGSAP